MVLSAAGRPRSLRSRPERSQGRWRVKRGAVIGELGGFGEGGFY